MHITLQAQYVEEEFKNLAEITLTSLYSLMEKKLCVSVLAPVHAILQAFFCSHSPDQLLLRLTLPFAHSHSNLLPRIILLYFSKHKQPSNSRTSQPRKRHHSSSHQSNHRSHSSCPKRYLQYIHFPQLWNMWSCKEESHRNEGRRWDGLFHMRESPPQALFQLIQTFQADVGERSAVAAMRTNVAFIVEAEEVRHWVNIRALDWKKYTLYRDLVLTVEILIWFENCGLNSVDFCWEKLVLVFSLLEEHLPIYVLPEVFTILVTSSLQSKPPLASLFFLSFQNSSPASPTTRKTAYTS